MSKKRTSSEEESNDDEQTNHDGAGLEVFKPGNNAKRARLASQNDTTLQDLPIELLECILVKVVAMEVNDMRMAECAWEENMDVAIDRLEAVCSHWSDTLAIKCFRCKVLRALELSQKTIRMEILQQFLIANFVIEVTSLRDEIFVLSWTQDTVAKDGDEKPTRCVAVYDRNNMGEVKDVIRQSGMNPYSMAACIVSNCVYVLGIMRNTEDSSLAVLRITKDAEHQFSISTWISDLRLSSSFISASATGNLIILSESCGRNPALVRIYDAYGSLKHKITLPALVTCIYDFRLNANVLEKSNGNLVLVSQNSLGKTILTEMATNGCILGQYQSTLGASGAVNFADSYGRILISDLTEGIELLDSQFNVLLTSKTGLLLDGTQFGSPYILHYDSEKNEVVGVYIQMPNDSVVAVIRLAEE